MSQPQRNQEKPMLTHQFWANCYPSHVTFHRTAAIADSLKTDECEATLPILIEKNIEDGQWYISDIPSYTP